jgi:tRNA-specific 2-thiouridylase
MMQADGRTVVVGMSGGVDSSLAAALLVQRGYRVIGMMLRLWSEPGEGQYNRCCTPDAMAQARRVASMLGIPFYAVDARDDFHTNVVKTFLDGYSRGITPNPCLACNRRIRWGLLMDRARLFGADLLATGHYARLERTPQGRIRLLRARDEWKDQSYVLSVLNQEQLAHTLLPLGDFTKAEVRGMAREMGLPVADRPESQDLCFLGRSDYRTFLLRHAPEVRQPGPIFDARGNLLGEHDGLAFYTIGQRKGLRIAAPQALYVLEKDLERNALVVGTRGELGRSELIADQVNWIAGAPPVGVFRAQVKIRYKADLAWGMVTPEGSDGMRIVFDQPLRDVTPGQAAVVYVGDECLGGGIISTYG